MSIRMKTVHHDFSVEFCEIDDPFAGDRVRSDRELEQTKILREDMVRRFDLGVKAFRNKRLQEVLTTDE